MALAQRSDLAILFIGSSRGIFGENLDRADLNLTGAQQKLVEAVHATGKPVVAVLISGGPITFPWIKAHVPAIVQGWYLGQDGGNAMAQMLFGEVNPGGKLPMTFPSEVGMVPCFYNGYQPASPRQYFGRKFSVLYPFGYGLSYTTFAYSDLRVGASRITPAQGGLPVRVEVTVTNTGSRAGDEVVQFYIHQRFVSVVRPVKELKGFARIRLEPGESREVSFEVGYEQLKFWKEGRWTVESGEVTLMVGGDSEHVQRAELSVRV